MLPRRVLVILSAWLIVIAAGLPLAFAKQVKFKYTSNGCPCEATIDDSKVKLAEAQRAVEFVNSGVQMSRTASFENTEAPPDVDDLIRKVEEMRQQNLARIPEHLLGLEIWKTERPKFVFEAELQAYLDRSNLEYRKTRDIQVLLKPVAGKPIPKECEKFAKALPTAETLLPIGEELAKRECATNRDPQFCKQKFLADPKNPQSVDELRAQVLTFGWHNCVNRQRDTEKSIARLEQAIHKKFLNTKCECQD